MKAELVQADITTSAVDAIVNAANSSLLGGGGVDGVTHRAAGPELLAECREARSRQFPDGRPAGDTVMTPGYALRARHVIHAVGPVFMPGIDQSATLASAFEKSLRLADEAGLRSIAFLAISTGRRKPPTMAARRSNTHRE